MSAALCEWYWQQFIIALLANISVTTHLQLFNQPLTGKLNFQIILQKNIIRLSEKQV
jgi:hypothetical protein